MAIPPIPVNRYLTPDFSETPPDGFQSIDQSISNGLPHRIDLDGGTTLLLVVPTGLAVTWRDADPTTVVSESDEALAPWAGQPGAPAGDASLAPARLVMISNGAILAATPLAAGLRRTIPDAGDTSGVRIEIEVLSWRICAGTLRGRGDYGSVISLAWRTASQAIDQFSIPPPNPIILPRILPVVKFESTLGLKVFEPLIGRFNLKKVVLA